MKKLTKNHEERQAYYRKIVEKEDQIDELRLQRNRIFELIEDIQGQSQTSYRRIEQLEYDLSMRSEKSQAYLNHLAEQRHHFDTKMQEDYEDVQQAHQTVSRRLDDEIEKTAQRKECLTMGLIYSKSESQNLIRVMEGNLAKAGSILQSLTQASKQLTSVLTVELKGQAYSSGLAVFDDIILPTMQRCQHSDRRVGAVACPAIGLWIVPCPMRS